MVTIAYNASDQQIIFNFIMAQRQHLSIKKSVICLQPADRLQCSWLWLLYYTETKFHYDLLLVFDWLCFEFYLQQYCIQRKTFFRVYWKHLATIHELSGPGQQKYFVLWIINKTGYFIPYSLQFQCLISLNWEINLRIYLNG